MGSPIYEDYYVIVEELESYIKSIRQYSLQERAMLIIDYILQSEELQDSKVLIDIQSESIEIILRDRRIKG